MFGEEKNLKDISGNSLKDTQNIPASSNSGLLLNTSNIMNYSKVSKLVTALYMVTDMIDEKEPLRNKLRALGVEILSDISSPELSPMQPRRERKGAMLPTGRPNLIRNIQSVLSFLDIAFTMNMISEMNKNILANEFNILLASLALPQDNPVWLEDFLKEENKEEEVLEDGNRNSFFSKKLPEVSGRDSKGHTRIGVQKGGTLMQALSRVEGKALSRVEGKGMSNRMPAPYEAGSFRSGSDKASSRGASFDLLKTGRRNSILNIIKKMGGSATLKDIKLKTEREGTLAIGEKTLQRELVSMIKDGVLEKSGEKRWSRYSIKN